MNTTTPFQAPATQRGLSLVGLIVVLAIVGMIGIVGMKVLPVALESRAIASAVQEAKSGSSVRDVQNNFDKRAHVADITSIKGADLTIVPNGAGFDVSYAYEKKIPLAGNASLLLEYAGATNPQAQPAQ
jgi:hypothetical protein